MSIKLKLDGFDDLLKQIEKANGNVQNATKQCMQKSAEIMQSELASHMRSADKNGQWGNLISSMPAPEIKNDHGLITASVGWEKGAYNPQHPSNAYKVIFLNYGTPRRKAHGQVKPSGFIQKAKKSARPKIKKQQEQTLKEILKGLE